MSKPQFIVACDRQFVDIFYHNEFQQASYGEFLTNVQKYVTIRQRDWLEKDNDYKQLIPYTVFRLKGTDKFATYRRTELVGESRLAGNSSVGFGGHIDIIDLDYDQDSIIDLAQTIFSSVEREISEEVAISGYLKSAFHHRYFHAPLYILNDDSNEAGEVHVGLVRIIDVNEDEIDGVKEQELEYLGFTDKETVLNSNPENWTKIILENI